MAASAGRDLRIKYDADGAGGTAAAVIAGARTDGVTIANEPIDITDKDDLGIQTLLDDIGTKVVTMNVEGVLIDSTLFDLALAAGDGTALHFFEVDLISLRTLTGNFFISNFESTGAEGTDPATFTMTLTSSGTIASA
jgi:predicted secreted protein